MATAIPDYSASYNWGNLSTSTITISTTSSGYVYSSGLNGTSWSSISSVSSHPGLSVSGDADIKGDLTVNGISVLDTLEAINQRLAILVPDPNKLEHFEALRKAYEHYKLMEALCDLPKKESK